MKPVLAALEATETQVQLFVQPTLQEFPTIQSLMESNLDVRAKLSLLQEISYNLFSSQFILLSRNGCKITTELADFAKKLK